jgi:hypothetical protein
MSPAIDTLSPSEFPALHDARHPVSRWAGPLEPYLRLLVERFQPERVILFGSQARGEADADSDFDLLVVRRGITSERASNLEIRCAFDEIPGVPPPFTLLSKTPERMAERLAAGSPFYEEIVRSGLTLYAAGADRRK